MDSGSLCSQLTVHPVLLHLLFLCWKQQIAATTTGADGATELFSLPPLGFLLLFTMVSDSSLVVCSTNVSLLALKESRSLVASAIPTPLSMQAFSL